MYFYILIMYSLKWNMSSPKKYKSKSFKWHLRVPQKSMNPIKHVQDLYAENYKTLMEHRSKKV